MTPIKFVSYINVRLSSGGIKSTENDVAQSSCFDGQKEPASAIALKLNNNIASRRNDGPVKTESGRQLLRVVQTSSLGGAQGQQWQESDHYLRQHSVERIKCSCKKSYEHFNELSSILNNIKHLKP